MVQAHDESVREAVEAYRVMLRAIRATSTPDWLDLDLTLAQIKVLFALSDDAGTATVGHVAERLGIGRPTASHLVDRLVQAGLVTRGEDPEDLRRTLPRLTPRGVELVDRLRGGAYYLPGFLRAVDDDDLAALIRGLRAVTRVADARL